MFLGSSSTVGVFQLVDKGGVKISRLRLIAGLMVLIFTFSPVKVQASLIGEEIDSTESETSVNSNSVGYFLNGFDLKEVEDEPKEEMDTFDATGPIHENATVVDSGNTSGDYSTTKETIKEVANNDSATSTGKYKIMVDPGHGYHEGSSGNGLLEDEYTLKVGKELYRLLKNDSRFTAYITRTKNVHTDNAGRRESANKKKVDFYLSIHLNYSDSSSAHGTETLYSPVDKGKSSTGVTNIQFAKIIQKYVQKATGFRDRGLVARSGSESLAVFSGNKAAASLVEVGFISNPAEAKVMVKNYKKYAKAMYNAFVYIATKYPKKSEKTTKTSNTAGSSSNLNTSLTSKVSLNDVSSAKKTVKTGKLSTNGGSGYTGTYTIAGRKYKMYSQSKDASAWSRKHGCSAAVLATMLSSAGYDYTGDSIHSASEDKDYSTRKAIKNYGIKSGSNSDYNKNSSGNPMTCFGLSGVLRNLGLSCDYVATWAKDTDAVNDITKALSSGKCVAVYVDSSKHDGVKFTNSYHCLLLVGFQENGCLNFINPAGGKLNYSHLTGETDLKLTDLVKYYMFKNSEKANQVVFNGRSRSGGYVKF